jgi:RNA polymerase sigma-70 factor (ECF subfamily)
MAELARVGLKEGELPMELACTMDSKQTHADGGPVDTELVDRIRKGDQAAFELMYERYFKRVYRFVANRLNIRADVEETTQEIFISVFSSIDSYRGDAPFAAWIFGISRRVIASRFKRKRHPTVPLIPEEPEHASPALSSMSGQMSGPPTPLEAYEYQERMDHMTSVLEQRLSSEQRLLFKLHHLEEVPICEIAERLGKSEDSIKSNLYRARKLLLRR